MVMIQAEINRGELKLVSSGILLCLLGVFCLFRTNIFAGALTIFAGIWHFYLTIKANHGKWDRKKYWPIIRRVLKKITYIIFCISGAAAAVAGSAMMNTATFLGYNHPEGYGAFLLVIGASLLGLIAAFKKDL